MEDLYHRILDDNECSSHANVRFNRHSKTRDRQTPGPFLRRDTEPPVPSRWQDATSTQTRINNNRKINMEPYRAPPSLDNVMSGFDELTAEDRTSADRSVDGSAALEDVREQKAMFEREGLAGVLRDPELHEERHRVNAENHFPAYRRHRRSLLRRRSIRLKESDRESEPAKSPATGGDVSSVTPSVKPHSNIPQNARVPTVPASNAPDREAFPFHSNSSHSFRDNGQDATKKVEHLSTVTGTTERAIMPPQGSPPGPAPSTSGHQRHPAAAIAIDSFNLLDDSVYITPAHRNDSGASQRLPSLGTDLTLDANGNIFGRENFDEQIIFLNGPDLLETSAEQQQQQQQQQQDDLPADDAERRQLAGKVAREVAREVAGLTGYVADEPQALPLRPIIRGPSDDHVVEDNVVVVYADQHETVR
uniref:Uncharacterized protein n=1 Tax=Anopheles maculatus TaxID=74869 RepID=A0A182SWW5_9DIPT